LRKMKKGTRARQRNRKMLSEEKAAFSHEKWSSVEKLEEYLLSSACGYESGKKGIFKS